MTVNERTNTVRSVGFINCLVNAHTEPQTLVFSTDRLILPTHLSSTAGLLRAPEPACSTLHPTVAKAPAASDLSCRRQNPARRRRWLTERCAAAPLHARHHSAIRSAHSHTCTECARRASHERARPGRAARSCSASRRRLPRHHRRPSGCRRSSSSPSSRRARASPTRCRQPSLSPKVAAVVAGTAWTVASGIVREGRVCD